MSARYDEVDHYIRDIERDADNYAEWLEARELERADTLAERGGEHARLKTTGPATGPEQHRTHGPRERQAEGRTFARLGEAARREG